MEDLTDEKYMRLALRLARKAAGNTSPNPLVGAVIVKENKILGSGYHKKAGLAHAEIEAINSCSNKTQLRGSTLYVTLEPCCIYGKTPPCTDAIIKNGIGKVVIAIPDPNPEVNGMGIKKLNEAGIKTITGVLDNFAKKQNEIFFKHITGKKPFITVKVASSIDGKTAAKNGDSKWITSEKSREMVKKIRYEHDCIITGINTISADNPTLLPVKPEKIKTLLTSGKKYYRIILDSRLVIDINSNIVKTSGLINTIIFASEHFKDNRIFLNKKKVLEDRKINVITIPHYFSDENNTGTDKKSNEVDYLLDLETIIDMLYQRFGITSILLESGKTLVTEFIKKGLIDKFIFFIAPKLIGGDSPYGIISGLNVTNINSAEKIRFEQIRKVGGDLVVYAYL